jgi:hypothetical protein
VSSISCQLSVVRNNESSIYKEYGKGTKNELGRNVPKFIHARVIWHSSRPCGVGVQSRRRLER